MSREASMTRRHFEFIENIINALRGTPEQRYAVALDFARAFEGVNPAFNRDMFINHAIRRDLKKPWKKPQKLTTNSTAAREIPNICGNE